MLYTPIYIHHIKYQLEQAIAEAEQLLILYLCSILYIIIIKFKKTTLNKLGIAKLLNEECCNHKQNKIIHELNKYTNIISQYTREEPTDDPTRTIQQKALRVIDYRVKQYFKTINQQHWAKFEDLIRQISECILDLKNLPEEQQDFRLCSLCASTRILEQNTTNRNGIAYFPSYYHQGYELNKVRINLQLTLYLLQQDYYMITLPKDHPVLLHSIRNLRKNKQGIQEIFGQIEVKEEYLDEQFEKVQFLGRWKSFKQNISGISDYRGLKLYIDADLLTNAGNLIGNNKICSTKRFQQSFRLLKIISHALTRINTQNIKICNKKQKILLYITKISHSFKIQRQTHRGRIRLGTFCLNQVKKK